MAIVYLEHYCPHELDSWRSLGWKLRVGVDTRDKLLRLMFNA